MNELNEKIDKLEDSLNNLDIIKELDNNFEKIINNKELMDKIKKYHEVPSEELKLDIYSYSEFTKYKENENDINLLIMEINTYLKKISNSRSCI